MNRIRILPEEISSKIAAGEVIERPSSVVRELIDNSIDADARRIRVRIEAGGRRYIRVTDDGTGMTRDDLLLCIERHATSKISTASDLYSIHTMGFRGEALASIGAVSRMEIITRTEDQDTGHRLWMQGGKLKSIEPSGCVKGTTVIVRDLFYNVPVRRRFLKSKNTEETHVMETFLRICVPFNHIHFSLETERRLLLNVPSIQDPFQRFSTIFGKEIASLMLKNEIEDGDIKAIAYLGLPDITRSRADRILIYVNRRNVRERGILRTILDIYGKRIGSRRYPYVIVFLEMPPSSVDINIHPTKQEVRFKEPYRVYRLVENILNDALRREFRKVFQIEEEIPKAVSDTKTPYIQSRDLSFSKIPSPSSSYRIIGRLKGMYILWETPDGLVIMDQHAAHERILYERIKEGVKDRMKDKQNLLIPTILEFSSKEALLIKRYLERIRSLSIDIEPFGPNTFQLLAVPAILSKVEPRSLIMDLLSIFESGKQEEDIMEEIAQKMACHAAIKAGDSIGDMEILRLLEDLLNSRTPTHCPHGRPIIKKITFTELDRMFNRI